jgi:hypothetical protein
LAAQSEWAVELVSELMKKGNQKEKTGRYTIPEHLLKLSYL